MKPGPLLATLLGLAALAGIALHLQPWKSVEQPATSTETSTAAEFVAQQLAIAPFDPAPLQKVSPETLRTRIETNLTARFGPDGLDHRTSAYSHLTLLPPGQDLSLLFVTMQAAGTRGWFDDHTGTVLVAEGFAPDSRSDDRATLIRLRTREALHRQGLHLQPEAGDDQWFTHHILHGALALALQSAASTGSGLPSAEETEREAVLMSLPVFLLNLAQSPEFIGLPYLEQRRAAGTSAWLDLLRTAPRYSHGFFGLTPDPLPQLPATGTTVLEESLGAYATQLLIERHSDYERAEELTPHWRGDHYRLFTNARGEHLVWHCRWATPEAASLAADILRNTLTAEATIPGSNQRTLHIDTRDSVLRLINCADPATLATLIN